MPARHRHRPFTPKFFPRQTRICYRLNMDLPHLQYFIAVAEAENFHRAAETLRIAQPALSRRIKALEDDLHTPLFVRRPQGTRLTEAGRVFLADAKRIIHELERARE